jgi:calcineurin-like phosphoesterase family protein
MGKSWFISDPHFGHKNIIKYERSGIFLDTEHMDNTIVENYNQLVNEGDIVYWLGDMFFCKSSRMSYIAQRLSKGRNILIRGNHDKGITNGKFLSLGFKPCRMFFLGGMMLTHEPISEDNMRHLSVYYGIRKNIHGHLHSKTEHLDPTKYQCVSVEKTEYKPIGFIDLMERFKDGEVWAKWAERRQNDASKSQ